MARTYTLRRRAEAQAETRQRIVDAAVELHGELGPARTSMSAVADRAGVQRNTLYSHFPDERSLLMACSAASLERDPLPDASEWRHVKKGEERLRAGLEEIYAWFARNAELVGCVLRDAEVHQPVQEIAALRYAPHFDLYEAVLGVGLTARQHAMLRLALAFHAWRSLARDSGLSPGPAVDTMVKAILAAS
jgi:AcrR family transcriptional regulator